jgi:uncharacterized membrane protein SirB2
MTLHMIMKFISLAVFLTISILQIRNFSKYKKTNGANTVRIVLFLINACFVAHNVRLLLGFNEGYFFSSMAALWMFLYLNALMKAEKN